MDLETAKTHRRTCRHCGHINGKGEIVETPHLTHYAELKCYQCGRHWDWISKPASQRKGREPKHTELVKKFGKGFCQMCLRTTETLPPKHGLRAHHVEEYQAGGSPERENIWIVCERCHSLIHWMRVTCNTESSNGTDESPERSNEPAAVGAVEDDRT